MSCSRPCRAVVGTPGHPTIIDRHTDAFMISPDA